MTVSTDLVYDVLRKHQPDHVLLRAARADAATGLLDSRRPGASHLCVALIERKRNPGTVFSGEIDQGVASLHPGYDFYVPRGVLAEDGAGVVEVDVRKYGQRRA